MGHSDNELINGRYFSLEEMEDIKEIIRLFPKLSRKELARTICETISWTAPNGKYKVEACLQFLEKLELKEQIVLPKKRKWESRGSKRMVIGNQTNEEDLLVGTVSSIAPLELESIRDSAGIRLWNEYIERYHMIGYKRPFGAHQRYFIWSRSLNRRLGCLLFSASAWALSERDAWIGWNKEDRSQRLSYIVNNTRFLIFPWVKVKNLASKSLSLAARQVPVDWQERYGFEPVLLETFVDIAHYRGTCYKAANWVLLGETAGRGRMDRYSKYLSSPKQIYMYPLRRDFRAILCGKGEGAQ